MVIIEDDDYLYRRLPMASCFKKNGRITSAAFKRWGEPEQNCSVDLARLTTPQESVDRADAPGFRLGRMKAKGPKCLGFDVVYDWQPNNDAHCEIRGENTDDRCKLMAGMLCIVEGVESSSA